MFGDTSKLFSTPASFLPNPKVTSKKPPTKNQFDDERATDTNYTATLQQLQVNKFLNSEEYPKFE